MADKQPIQTSKAPAAIGPYSQAVRSGSLVFLSGQIPLDPQTMELVGADAEAQARQVFKNLEAVTRAAGGGLDDIIKLTIFLTDLDEFARVNAVMAEHFSEPYPARETVEISALPKGALVEVSAIMAG